MEWESPAKVQKCNSLQEKGERKMKLWKIPHRWDYHKQGAIVVLAETKEEAVAKVKSRIQDFFEVELIEWDKISEVDGIYKDGGCDC